MYTKKRTIAHDVSFSGIGLHTGETCTITFRPTGSDHGIKFQRSDIPGSEPMPADIDHVINIDRGTTIGIGDVKVHTVEHVLAALTGLGIDNVLIELSGPEPPVGDGSAKPFVDALLEAGITEFDEEKEYLEIDTPMSYSEPDRKVDIVVTPSDDFRITFMIDYPNPALGTQYTFMADLEKEFIDEFAPSRTFCFLSEVEMLKKQGLIKGGSLNSAIVISDAQNGEDEIARIRERVGLELECFVHGSVCISYSGRCYMSAFMANRSANTGECAHPCRWNYTLVEEKRPGEYYPVYENDRGTYVMSSKDLCMIEHLDKLHRAGVNSFKIEGRTKGINYVAGVVKTYREAIDAFDDTGEYKVDDRWIAELRILSNRGYTTGTYLGDPDTASYNHDEQNAYRMNHSLMTPYEKQALSRRQSGISNTRIGGPII